MADYPYKPEISDELLAAIEGMRDDYIRMASSSVGAFRNTGEYSQSNNLLENLQSAHTGSVVNTNDLKDMLGLCNGINTINNILRYKDSIDNPAQAEMFTRNMVAFASIAVDENIGRAAESTPIGRAEHLPKENLDLSARHIVTTYWDEINELVETNARHCAFVPRKAFAQNMSDIAKKLNIHGENNHPGLPPSLG